MNWKKPIFIVACTNSGTKLLQNILALNTNEILNFPIEPHYFGFGPNLDGRLNRLFALWPCFKSTFEQPNPDIFYHAEFGPNNKQLFTSTIEQYLELKCKDKLPADDKRILIKEPKFSLRIPWILKMFPDAKILCLIRNPWSVSEGIKRRLSHIGDIPLHVDIPTCTAQWNTVASLMMMTQCKNTKWVRYEDIINHYQSQDFWKPISDFLELSNPIECPKEMIEPKKLTQSFDNLKQWETTFIFTACQFLIKYFGYEEFVQYSNSKPSETPIKTGKVDV